MDLITRKENLLGLIAGEEGAVLPEPPYITREEKLLYAIYLNGGGGGDVTKEYVDTSIANAVEAVEGDISEVAGAVENKVDKVTGKGLSTNDYTDADKALVQNSPITNTGTGTDLTLSTAEGKVKALTIYGKSEAVDGAITSAGEGWATVDLGTLTWSRQVNTDEGWAIFYATVNNIVVPTGTSDRIKGLLCSHYPLSTQAGYRGMENKSIMRNNGYVIIKDDDYSDAAAFKTAMSGVLLCYQLADPTQGNAIAVKTDNGTGIDGTMWTFETGTPLRGIPDTTVRDSAVCDGQTGTVTKVCAEVDLGALTWNYDTTYQRFFTNSISTNIKIPTNTDIIANIKTPKYTSASVDYLIYKTPLVDKIIAVGGTGNVSIRDTNYTDTTDFTSALSGVMLVYELATPTTTPMTSTEIQNFNGLRTFTPTTHIANNAEAEMTASAYANTGNGKAIADLKNELKITQSDTLTLTVAGWSSNQQTVAYSHDTAKRNVIDVFPASVEEWASCGVLAISDTAAGITFKCKTVPTNALTFRATSMGVSV